MLTPEETEFLLYWEQNRLTEKKSLKPLLVGLSIGLGLGLLVAIIISSGWYTRASMVANSKMNGVVFIVAFLFISLFIAWLYRTFRWETREQEYHSLLYKQKQSKNTSA